METNKLDSGIEENEDKEDNEPIVMDDIKVDKLDVFLSPWACECGGIIKDAGGHCRTCQANGVEDNESQFMSLRNKGRRFSFGYESRLDQFLKFLATNGKYKEDRMQGRVVGMYKFHCEIGCGGFSKVKLATHIFTKEQVAIKIIDKSRFPGELEKILGQEVRCMEVLNHPNLIRLYEVIESVDKVHLVTEWAPAGDLYSKVKANGKIGEPDAKFIFRQIIDAVLYMHDNRIYHRDIKAENVLFSTPTLCKVCDFGFSTVGRKDKLLSTFCGSPAYSAPELYQKIQYEGGPADVWSLGIVLYYVTEGRLPFNGSSMSSLRKDVLDGNFKLSENLSNELTQLMKQILKQKPSERFTVAQIKNHPWLSQLDEAASTTSLQNTHPFNNFKVYDLQESLLSNLGSAYESRYDIGKLDANCKADLTCNGCEEVNYRLIPTKEQIMFRLVTKQEVKAYEILLEIGVSEAKIRAHKCRGMRSYLVGIYRIILHKVQKGELIDVNKLGLHWDMSGSMMNLNSRSNLKMEESEALKVEESEDSKENGIQDEHQSSNEEGKDITGGDVDEEQVELDNSKSSPVSGSPTLVSSQKKRILAKSNHIVLATVCVIL